MSETSKPAGTCKSKRVNGCLDWGSRVETHQRSSAGGNIQNGRFNVAELALALAARQHHIACRNNLVRPALALEEHHCLQNLTAERGYGFFRQGRAALASVFLNVALFPVPGGRIDHVLD
jgi:hypothetical protein